MRLGKNRSLVLAEVDDTVAHDDIHAVGSDASRLKVFNDAFGERDVAAVVAEGARVMLLVRTRNLTGKQLFEVVK